MEDNTDLKSIAGQFVQGLAADLSGDNLDLPGFPDTVIELQRALGDIGRSVKDIVVIINSEPALAARLIRLANSAAFNATRQEICDPRSAITQLGFNTVRSTATEFAIRQLEQQEWLIPVRPLLESIRAQSNGVAAVCAGIAKNIDGMREDESLAAGLFHQIGQLYLVTHGHRNNMAVNDPEWKTVANDWHPTIARAIIESWGMPEHVAVAVEHQDALIQEKDDCTALLTKLLSAAKLHHRLSAGEMDNRQAIEDVLRTTEIIGTPFIDLTTMHRDDIDLVRQTMLA